MRFHRSRLSQALAAALGLAVVPFAAAQVVRDGTMGPSGPVTATALSTPDPKFSAEFRIPAADGQQRGGNLFHSFSQFDIVSSRRATFTGPGDVTNIISRVTGGSPSLILGGLRSEIAGANLFLLNPSGVFFGPNASLDVSGSFHTSTAHYLALGTSGRYDTVNLSATVLASAPPSAFGFLAAQPIAPVVVDGSMLTGAPGAAMTFTAGGVQVGGASLIAPGGFLGIASVGGAGEIALSASDVLPQAGMTRGVIEVSGGTGLTASSTAGFAGGKVVIRGGILTLQNSGVGVQNDEPASAQGVVVDGSESLSMQGALIGTATTGSGSGGVLVVASPVISLSGSAISALSSGAGAASAVDVQANQIALTGGSFILSGATAAGAAGTVHVSAVESLSMSGGSTSITSTSSGAGRGGDVVITAPALTLEGAVISASVSGTGAAGNVAIQADRISFTNGAQVLATTTGAGSAGDVTVDAITSVEMSGRGNGRASGLVTSTAGSGSAGDIVIRAPAVSVTNGFIAADAFSTGAPGNITIEAQTVAITGGGTISASTAAPGAGSTVRITASESFSLSGQNSSGDRSVIAGANSGAGSGSDIVITAPAFSVDAGGISTASSGTGPGGDITIVSDRFALSRGGQIVASSLGAGAAGNLTIDATTSVDLTGRDSGRISGLSTTAFASGAGGDTIIRAPVVNVDNAFIGADALGTGSPGSVTIAAQRVAITGGGVVSSSSNAPGPGGAVSITATESFTISGRDGSDAASVVRGTNRGDGGGADIVIDTPVLTIDGGGITAATSGAGPGGSIRIDADRVALINGGQISANSLAAGRSGDVRITARETIEMRGTGLGRPSGLFARATGSGDGGAIVLIAPGITLDGATVNAGTDASGAAGSITVATAQLLLANGAQIDLSTTDRGRGGRIDIVASESVTVAGRNDNNASEIVSGASGTGIAGAVSITAPVITIDGGIISGSASGAGAGGDIKIDASRLALSNNGQIVSAAAGSGSAGNIQINAAESVTITSRSASLSGSGVFTVTSARGRSGDIDITSPIVNVAGGSVAASTGGIGDAGNVSVFAGSVNVSAGGVIDSSSFFSGNAGIVRVRATGAINVLDPRPNVGSSRISSFATGSGRGGEVILSAPLVNVEGGAVTTSTSGAGDAGRIAIDAQDVKIVNGGRVDSSSFDDGSSALAAGAAGVVSVTASSSVVLSGIAANGTRSILSSATDGRGTGGDVFINAPLVTVSDALVSANTSGRGAAGRIGIDAQHVTVSDGGVIASGTTAAGAGGRLSVTATEAILVTGRNAEGRSRITNSSSGAGNAGEISISAPSIALQNEGFVRGTASDRGDAGRISIRGGALSLASGGEISTSTAAQGAGGAIDIVVTQAAGLTDSSIRSTSEGAGDAGNIFIDAGRALTLVNSSITTEATRADGGNIEIMAIDLLRLTDSQITTSVGTGRGNGGNITIDPVFVILDSSRIIANAFGGDGGNINIVTSALLQTGDSIISASSELGIQGTIEISAPDSDLAGGLTPLPGGLFDSSLLLRESCSARAGRGGNSFVGVGYGGLPERPGTLAFSSYAQRAPASAGHSASLFALAASFESACAR